MQKYKILAVVSMITFSAFSLTYVYKSLWKKWNSSYVLKVEIDNVGMLAIGTPVLMNGVNVGNVKDLYLNSNGSVMLELNIDKKVKLPIGSEVKISVQGMIGNLIVNIYRPSKIRGYLKNGDSIKGSGPISPGVVLEKATDIAEQIKDLVSELDISHLNDSIKSFIDNFNSILYSKDEVTEEKKDNLKDFIIGLSETGKELKKISKNKSISKSVENIERITDRFSQLFDSFSFELFMYIDNNLKFNNVELSLLWKYLYISKSDFSDLNRGYSFMLKKDFVNLDIAAGMIDNLPGAGAYFNILDKLVIGAEVYDFENYKIVASAKVLFYSVVLKAKYLYNYVNSSSSFKIGVGCRYY